MINAAFDADKVNGRVLEVFRRVKSFSSIEDRTRKRVVSIDKYLRVIGTAPPHLRAMIQISIYTWMRHGEIRKLK